MRRVGDMDLKSRIGRLDLLETLRENLKLHGKVVAEAREGYLKEATRALEARLTELKAGRVVPLHFGGLAPPPDYSDAYKQVIRMLERSVDETVVLGAEEFSRLVEDNWEWKSSWLSTNAMYSVSARAMAYPDVTVDAARPA